MEQRRVRLSIRPNQIISDAGKPHLTFHLHTRLFCVVVLALCGNRLLCLCWKQKGEEAVMLVTLHTHGTSVALKSRACTCLVSAACHVCLQIGFTHLWERGGHAVACEDGADIVSSSYCVCVALASHAAMSGFAYSVQKLKSWKTIQKSIKTTIPLCIKGSFLYNFGEQV